MVREEFYFDSRDGQSKIHAVRFAPDAGKEVRGVVQIVHGMSEHIERYHEFAEFLTDKGFVVTGDDHLGHGKSVGENGKFGYFCKQDPATVVVRDVHRLKKKTESEYPGVPYFIIGHSMGSFILRNYLIRYGSGITGAVILGTGMQARILVKTAKAVAKMQSFFGGAAKEGKLINRLAFGNYNARIENPSSPSAWLSRDEKKVAEYDNDPMCGFVFTANGFCTLFGLIDRLYDDEALRKIPVKLPVFMAAGDADPVGDYGEGVKRAYESLRSVGMTNVQLKLYNECRHELLNELNRNEVMQDILNWLENVMSSL